MSNQVKCTRDIRNKFPSEVLIEISGKCNGKYPYCARHRFKQRYSGEIMSAVLFEQILDHLFNIGILHTEHNSTIRLFNWGEPFLNPEINKILAILKKKKLYAGISSNFIVKPKIDNDNLHVISEVCLSLSGFTQNSYAKIHGASLRNVLDNFEDFRQNLNYYSPDTYIGVIWHRYKFNEKEFWEAYKYFNKWGIHFLPRMAGLSDIPEMLSFIKGELSEERKRQADNDLFLDYISECLDYHRQRSKDYKCLLLDYLVIDEFGQLLLCCGISNENTGYVLGNVLKMSAEEIWERKLSVPICRICISSGLHRVLTNSTFPTGGKINHLKLWCQINANTTERQIRRIITILPYGNRCVRILRKIKEKL